MTLLGKLICAARKLLRVKKVHNYKRRMVTDEHPAVKSLHASAVAIRECSRCGHTAPVKPRKPRATKQETVK